MSEAEAAGSRPGRLRREVAHEPAKAVPASSCDDVELRARPAATSGTFSKQQTPTREMIDLAWPIAAAMLGETAIGLVDTKLVGGLGAAALGGVGIATTLMFLGYAVVFGLMRGVKTRASHAIGERRHLDSFVYARSGVLMGAALGVAIMLASRDVSGILRALGADPAIIPYARDFLAAVTLGAPSTCALAALIQHRQAIGDSRSPMIVGIAGNVFNALFAWGLIYGRFGLPALGVRGGAYATAVTETLELVVMGWLLLHSEREAKAAAATLEPRLSFGKAARDVAELGVPTGLQVGAEMLAFTTFTAVLGGLGTSEIAGHHIALNVIRISFLPGVAIAEAASVMIGKSLGRRNVGEADAVVKSALTVAVGFMAACGVGFALGGGFVARLFSTDPGVMVIARRLLFIAALFQVLDAVSIVLRGALRAAKDVRVAAVIGIAVMWACIPTAAFIFGKKLGLGALGGWIGFVAETGLGALFFWLRWKRGPWRREY